MSENHWGKGVPPSRPSTYVGIGVSGLALAGLYVTSLYSFLLFHCVAEISSIVIACSIFLLAWNSRQFMKNDYLVFIGIASLFVAGLDLLHTLAYKGMGVFSGYDANLPTQLWISARYLQSASFFIAPFFLNRRINCPLVFVIFSLISVCIVVSIFFWGVFPDCFIEGTGLTGFKKISEYLISCILVGALAMLIRHRADLPRKVLVLVAWAIVANIASELAFTFYVSVYGLSNLIGHFLKIVVFYLLCKAIVEVGLREPYQLLFRELVAERDALRQSEERYRITLMSVGDGIIATDAEGRVELMNPVAEALTCRQQEEARGMPLEMVFRIVNEETRMPVENPVRQAVRQGIVVGLANHTLLIAADGTESPVADSCAPIHSENGAITGAVLVFRDQTDERAAQKRLMAEKERAQQYLDVAGVMMCALDANADVTMVNKTGCRILEYTEQEILGKNWFEHFLPELVRDRIKGVFSRVIAGVAEHDEYVENTVLTRQGEPRLIAWHNSILRDGDGSIVGTLSSGEDITDRKRAEEELREAKDNLEVRVKQRTAELEKAKEAVAMEQRRLYHLLETLPAGVMLLTPDHNVRFANRFFRERFGEPDGKRCFELLFGRGEPCEICEPHTVLNTMAPHQWQWTALDSRTYDVYGFPFTDTDGSTVIMEMGIDVTERKRAEQDLNRTLDDLTRSNDDLEHFAYVASHDLQEPLRSAANALQMLEKRHKGTLGKESDLLIHYAVDSAKRMKALISDLLTYSRLTTRGQPFATVNVQEVSARSILNLASLIDRKGAEITYDEIPTVQGDFTQLLQVFQNLIGNAVKFGPAESPTVHVSARKEANEWVFAVKDNGIGIDSQHFERIFVIFQQLAKKGDFEGTGMGLAIVKKIVERHRGRVWVESKVGAGSTFYFTIPDATPK